jgi:hypothetical protein
VSEVLVVLVVVLFDVEVVSLVVEVVLVFEPTPPGFEVLVV